MHLPLRYEDETQIQDIAALRPGMSAQVEGEIVRSDVILKPRRQLTAVLRDDTAEVGLRWLTFYPSQQTQMQAGKRWRVRGEVRGGLYGYELIHPRISAPGAALSVALTPIYPTTDGLSQPSLRQAITQALGSAAMQDTLPAALLEKLDLMPFEEAVRTLHAPTPEMDAHALMEHEHPAWTRIKFDELLAQQLSLAAARAARQSKQAQPFTHKINQSLVAKLKNSLPFTLTGAQHRVSDEIAADLGRSFPMYRLLQCWKWQDRCCGSCCSSGYRSWRTSRINGTDRNTCRTTLRQTQVLVRSFRHQSMLARWKRVCKGSP